LRLLVCLLLGGSALYAGHGDDAAEIREARLRQNQAIAAHDLPGIEQAWDSTIVVTAGMGVAFRGAAIYRKAFEDEFAAFPNTRYERRPDTIEVSRVRPLAAERGIWVRNWTATSGKGEMRGTYMAMWRKTAGEWRIRSELFVLLTCTGPACPQPEAP
jgi:ketosteroid isomerase-like protein